VRLEKRRIVYAAAAIVGTLCVGVLALEGADTAGVRACIRGTARTSLALLLVVFSASALARRWPRPATRWLLRNRRYLGLSLAVSHGFHLVFIVSLSAMGQGRDTSFATVYGGGLAFVLLAVMAATSNDASQRWLGAAWRRLHLLGVYALWLVFASVYLPQAADDLLSALSVLALLGALLLRLWPVRKSAEREREAQGKLAARNQADLAARK
jgi:DMSO/TMAO reductase YedYZ heme-binding membrane subunit